MAKNENYACKVVVNRADVFLLSLISTPFPLYDLPLDFCRPILPRSFTTPSTCCARENSVATNDNKAVTTGICPHDATGVHSIVLCLCFHTQPGDRASMSCDLITAR